MNYDMGDISRIILISVQLTLLALNPCKDRRWQLAQLYILVITCRDRVIKYKPAVKVCEFIQYR